MTPVVDGTGTCLLMMPGERGFEYQAKDNWYYLYSVTSVNRTDETWSIPSSSTVIGPGESETYGYRFTVVDGQEKMEDSILAGGSVNFRVAPSMVIPRGQEVKFALRSNYLLGEISPQYPQNTKISSMVEAPCGFKTVSATFDKLGENTLLLSYGGYLPMHRGAWRIDGEIDHGFTGAVHGTGCYIVNDPVFGEIVCGGKLVNSPSEWSVTLQDGVRRYVAIPQYNRFEMKLESNGISPESPVTVHVTGFYRVTHPQKKCISQNSLQMRDRNISGPPLQLGSSLR